MISDETMEILTNTAVKYAVMEIIGKGDSMWKGTGKEKGEFMAQYLKKCKKGLIKEMNEAIKNFESWR